MLETYILKIDKDLSKDDFERLLDFVSEEKKERITRFHRFEDAQRSLIGDVLARYTISKRLGIRNKDLVLGANEYGKPVLIAPSDIHFNISHSGSWVVCAIDDNPVGIDVEVMKPIDFKIAERFFSRDEYESLMNQPDEMRLKYFYIIWTLKESYIKAEGKGLSIPLNSFSIKIENQTENIFFESGLGNFFFRKFFLDKNTVCALCSMNNDKIGSCCNNGLFLIKINSILMN